VTVLDRAEVGEDAGDNQQHECESGEVAAHRRTYLIVNCDAVCHGWPLADVPGGRVVGGRACNNADAGLQAARGWMQPVPVGGAGLTRAAALGGRGAGTAPLQV
jgi:hypothetical protein